MPWDIIKICGWFVPGRLADLVFGRAFFGCACLAMATLPASAQFVGGLLIAPDALQDKLDSYPDERATVTTLARKQGLDVLSLKVGAKTAPVDVLLVTGGGKGFRDCAETDVCPEMVLLPASPPGFEIGARPDDPHKQVKEAPHKVAIKPFAAGRTKVTVGEYQRCVEAGGCRPPEWLEPGNQNNIHTGVQRYYRIMGETVTGRDYPIVGVSWDDATAYAKWLSEMTGRPYRLLSEAEWEFAARAGTETAYWWGNDIQQDGKVWASCKGCGSAWDGKSAAPVRGLPANPWGLYGVHGSVWEWVADIYCESYAAGPSDGSPRMTDDCPVKGSKGMRGLRGGSSWYEPHLVRAAVRLRNLPDFRTNSIGFRVARDVGL